MVFRSRLDQFIQSYQGKIIISFIIGVGIGALFKKMCKDGSCIEYIAPLSSENVVSNIYTHDGKCYRFIANTVSCKGKTDIVDGVD